MISSLSQVPHILIEVCVDSLQSAVTAQENGADRLEVCANLAVGGGTTPSAGLVRCILENGDLPLMVLIRCRTGDFVYSPSEHAVMLADIDAVRHVAQQHPGREVGVVIGALTPEGAVNEAAVRALVLAAKGMPVTFHRAFDMVRDPEEALETLATIGGVRRILTSGLAPTCLQGVDCLERLYHSVHRGGLIIMPGSGINTSTVVPLLTAIQPCWQATGSAREVHLSAGGWVSGREKLFRREGMGFGLGVMAPEGEEREKREWGRWEVSTEELAKVRRMTNEFVEL